MRAVCRYLADALDRCSGSTLQQRWNDFEKRFWPKWKAGVDRRGREYWTWGARVLISARMIAPSLDMLSDLRVNQWIAHLPEDHPLAQQHTSLLQATDSITWTSAHSRQLAVSNGLRILLVRGYDSLHHIKDDDLKLLAVRWSKGTDALDAALCSLGVFSRTPKRGSARHGRRQRMTASELVENAGVPDRFRQVMILYLETYEARVSDVYRTLRHKVIALAHFWRFIRERHPDVKRCSQILPRHVRDYIPHAISTRSRGTAGSRCRRRSASNCTQLAGGPARFLFRPLRLGNRTRLSLQALRSANDSSDAPHVSRVRFRKSTRTHPSSHHSDGT